MEKKPKKRKHSLERRNEKWGFLLLAPWIIGVLLFFINPLIKVVMYSFNDIKIDLVEGIVQSWKGVDNYVYVLTSHGTFYQELLTTIATVVPNTIIIVLFALFAAVLLNGNFKGRSLFRVVFFLSIIMSTDLISVQLSTTTNMEVSNDSEVSNMMFLASFLIKNTGFPKELMFTILDVVGNVFSTVKLSGVQTLIFLSGLQTITPSHYEVAKIEGATAYETFFKVTVPMLSPLILTCTIYTIADNFMNTDVVDLINYTSFNIAQYGQGAAMSVIYLICVLLIIGITSFIIGKKVYYSD